MTLSLSVILFLLATVVLLLLTLPFALMAWELDEFRENVKFWTIVLAAWAMVWFAVA